MTKPISFKAAAPEAAPSSATSSTRHFSHEAAGPLMTIAMLTEMLLDDGGLPSAQADDVRKIQRAGEQLSQMIKTLRGV